MAQEAEPGVRRMEQPEINIVAATRLKPTDIHGKPSENQTVASADCASGLASLKTRRGEVGRENAQKAPAERLTVYEAMFRLAAALKEGPIPVLPFWRGIEAIPELGLERVLSKDPLDLCADGFVYGGAVMSDWKVTEDGRSLLGLLEGDSVPNEEKVPMRCRRIEVSFEGCEPAWHQPSLLRRAQPTRELVGKLFAAKTAIAFDEVAVMKTLRKMKPGCTAVFIDQELLLDYFNEDQLASIRPEKEWTSAKEKVGKFLRQGVINAVDLVNASFAVTLLTEQCIPAVDAGNTKIRLLVPFEFIVDLGGADVVKPLSESNLMKQMMDDHKAFLNKDDRVLRGGRVSGRETDASSDATNSPVKKRSATKRARKSGASDKDTEDEASAAKKLKEQLKKSRLEEQERLRLKRVEAAVTGATVGGAVQVAMLAGGRAVADGEGGGGAAAPGEIRQLMADVEEMKGQQTAFHNLVLEKLNALDEKVSRMGADGAQPTDDLERTLDRTLASEGAGIHSDVVSAMQEAVHTAVRTAMVESAPASAAASATSSPVVGKKTKAKPPKEPEWQLCEEPLRKKVSAFLGHMPKGDYDFLSKPFFMLKLYSTHSSYEDRNDEYYEEHMKQETAIEMESIWTSFSAKGDGLGFMVALARFCEREQLGAGRLYYFCRAAVREAGPEAPVSAGVAGMRADQRALYSFLCRAVKHSFLTGRSPASWSNKFLTVDNYKKGLSGELELRGDTNVERLASLVQTLDIETANYRTDLAGWVLIFDFLFNGLHSMNEWQLADMGVVIAQVRERYVKKAVGARGKIAPSVKGTGKGKAGKGKAKSSGASSTPVATSTPIDDTPDSAPSSPAPSTSAGHRGTRYVPRFYDDDEDEEEPSPAPRPPRHRPAAQKYDNFDEY